MILDQGVIQDHGNICLFKRSQGTAGSEILAFTGALIYVPIGWPPREKARDSVKSITSLEYELLHLPSGVGDAGADLNRTLSLCMALPGAVR